MLLQFDEPEAMRDALEASGAEIVTVALRRADLSGKNPNVFYELGLAHAIGKPVVMVAATIDDVPFDLRGLRTILYDKENEAWGEELRERIGADHAALAEERVH